MPRGFASGDNWHAKRCMALVLPDLEPTLALLTDDKPASLRPTEPWRGPDSLIGGSDRTAILPPRATRFHGDSMFRIARSSLAATFGAAAASSIALGLISPLAG